MKSLAMKRFVGFLLGSSLAVACSKVDFQSEPSAQCQGGGPDACITTGGIDYFTENIAVPFPNNKTDILVISDNSGSMRVEQGQMGARIGSFLNQITQLDWRIGIITTDMNGNGPTQGGNLLDFVTSVGGPSTGLKYITPSTPSSGSLFNSTVQRTETGYGDERAIYAAISALEKSAQTGFIRPEAHLSVVILSDEDERSNGGNIAGRPLEAGKDFPQDLINKSKALWPNKSLTVHGIVIKPGDTVCHRDQTVTGGGANGNYGNVYADLVNRTGGELGSVCEYDYGSQLSRMGQVTGATLQSHNIRCTPMEGSVRVTTSTGSTYDCPRGPVADPQPVCRFEGAKVIFAPPLMAGQQVTLQYACPR